MSELRIATRGSKLALWQAEHVRACLQQEDRALRVSLLVVKTQGDRVLDRPLHQIGGKGLFTKEIEEALLLQRADLAVHSMKDLPSEMPEGLLLAAVPVREDPSDALILGPAFAHLQKLHSPAAAAKLLAGLPAGARIGTSSLRRICQLYALRPDLEIVPLRGNVDTRLRKLDAGEFDAAVLATAGLLRLGLAERISARFSSQEMVPACGQGALALQCRTDDVPLRQRLAALRDASSTLAVLAERDFTLRLGGNCQTPLGAYAQKTAQGLHIAGMVGSLDGKTQLRAELHSTANVPPETLGRALAEHLLTAGATAFLKPFGTP